MLRLPYRRVVDDDLLQSGTKREHAVSLVILLLLTHKEEPDLRIANHKLYLLLRTRGIERHRDGTNAESTKVRKQIMHRVL